MADSYFSSTGGEDSTAQAQAKNAEDAIRNQGWSATKDAVDTVVRSTGWGAVNTAIGDSFFGINHRQTPNAIQVNKDNYGMVFFTRPKLNLTTENIRGVRLLAPLLTNQPASIQRIVRCLLSPDLQRGRGDGAVVNSPFVDPHQAFIPILTNHILSMSGWPDVVVPKRIIEEGMYKEAYGFVDGVSANYSAYNITANFRNIPGDPINALFFIWAHYMSLVYEGTIVPFPEMIVQNEIDYMTRIYRLVLDPTKTKVQKIAACGAAWPEGPQMGAAFNFESDRPFNNSQDQISISFQAFGAMYQDDILIDEFNRTTQLFNVGLEDRNRESLYKQVPLAALGLFNHRGYPRINPDNYDLEWWVDRDDYKEVLGDQASGE